MNNIFKEFNSKPELHHSLAKKVASLLDESIKKDGKAILAVSGGSTPKPFFKELNKIDIPWEKIIITLVDEDGLKILIMIVMKNLYMITFYKI